MVAQIACLCKIGAKLVIYFIVLFNHLYSRCKHTIVFLSFVPQDSPLALSSFLLHMQLTLRQNKPNVALLVADLDNPKDIARLTKT